MKNTNLTGRVLGGIVFAASLIIYSLTLEPTASWWDCSEIITSGYKLEVGHPPGAPFHMLLSRFFTIFTSNPTKAALLVNFMSAMASAATVLFLFWSIILLARKLFPHEKLSPGEQISIWGSGLIGSLAFAFTDTFWFSAVEGEVYALSSFFTAVVFWAALKWESSSGQPGANRWLILIAYLIGLSTGVHLLSLLVIPVIGLIWYFKRRRFSWPGLLKIMILSGLVLVFIQYILIPGTANTAFLLDRLFVNSFRLPFNSGMVFLFFLVIIICFAGIFFTHRKRWFVMNTLFLSLLSLYIGYSSYALIVIRAFANPPMNQNHPDNAFALRKYLGREQYGDRPFLYGQYYNAPAIGLKGSKPEYSKTSEGYELTSQLPDKVNYDSRFLTVFPRMYSSDPYHIQVYKDWGKVKGIPLKVTDYEGEKTVTKPTFIENTRFFLSYQLGYMYFRYFMWNFAGRQNDKQGDGGYCSGNWISGFRFLDSPRTCPEKIPYSSVKKDPSRNVYFFLPLLLGLAGMVYQYNRDHSGRKDFWIVSLLFFMTGIAIVIYLNQTPMQPRERDYAYVGSFYAFSVWIGLGTLWVVSLLKKIIPEKQASIAGVMLAFMGVPLLLLSKNYDDHDRSGRYMVRDYARNYLESCAPNAILFTYGDNDTFPLWYAQEVEGIRTDIRVINMDLLSMDWYISQLGYKQNQAEPVKFSWTRDKYFMGRRDAILISEENSHPININEAMVFAGSDDRKNKLKVMSGEFYNYFPSRSFFLPVDRQKVIQSGAVKSGEESLIADSVTFTINAPYLQKSDVAILNIIAANNWERPVYFNHSTLYSGSMFFSEWLQYEGLAYRLIPVRTLPQDEFPGRIDTDILYRNVMGKFTWGNVNQSKVYLDKYNRHEILLLQGRYLFTRLAKALNDEGKFKMAEKVLDRLFEVFPDSKIPLTFDSFPAAEEYYRAGALAKGNSLAEILAENSFSNLRYFHTLKGRMADEAEEDVNLEISLLENIKSLILKYSQKESVEKLNSRIDDFIGGLSTKGKS